MQRQSPLPVRQVIRTERPGGSAFVHLFPPPVAPLFGGEYLAVDRTGGYVLVWRAGNATNGLALHGWVHGGRYHSLAPAFPLSYPGGLYQMTW